MKLGVKNVTVINPGCNYPIPINDEAKEFAKKIYGNASPKLITISRLDGRKSHHNIMMTVKNLLPKYPAIPPSIAPTKTTSTPLKKAIESVFCAP